MNVPSAAVKHAAEIRQSGRRMQDGIDYVRDFPEHWFGGGLGRAQAQGRAFLRVEIAHWERCLLSAKQTGANQQFYRDMLRRWGVEAS